MKNSVTFKYFIVTDILKYLSSFKNSYDFFTVKVYVNNICFFFSRSRRYTLLWKYFSGILKHYKANKLLVIYLRVRKISFHSYHKI
jgi:hypothetical protein